MIKTLIATFIGAGLGGLAIISFSPDFSGELTFLHKRISTVSEEISSLKALGSGGQTVINDPNAASIPISLTADVTGVLPQANGGSNASTNFTAGSILFDDGTRFVQNNSQLFWDNTNLQLGIGTSTLSANSGKVAIQGGLVINGNLHGVATATVGALNATTTLSVGSTSPSSPWALAVVGPSDFAGPTTTLEGDVNITRQLWKEGPTGNCGEVLTAIGTTFWIDFSQGCQDVEIGMQTADFAINYKNASFSGSTKFLDVWNESSLIQLSFASTSASSILTVCEGAASSTPLAMQEGVNHFTLTAKATSTIPYIDICPTGASTDF